MAELLKGKRGLITGIANNRSIAWGIAEAMKAEGAELAFGVQMDVFGEKVKPLATELGVDLVLDYNVQNENSTQAAFDRLSQEWGGIDFAVHAIAYSDKNELTGRFIDTSRENFKNSLEISAYSFIDMAKKAEPLMKEGGTLITLTYQGSRKATPWYNVMGVAKAALEASVKYLAEDLGKDGIRVNAISAGPIKTLAASGIGDFRYIMKWNEYNSPLRRTVTTEDVGKAALFLLSDLGSGTTGENLHVDAGYHVVGMKAVDAPDMSKE